MRYENEPLQDRLAAEYVLGNLRGAARSRLVTLMRCHAGLRGKVAQWEERLFPLVMRAPKIKAPPRVWRAIHARIAPDSSAGFGARAWWRRFVTGGFAAAALAALVYVAVAPPRAPPPFTKVAVLNDARAQPGILVSWTPQQAAKRQLAVRILGHPPMPPGTSWQAWLVSGPSAAPLPLGLVTTDETQVLEISPAAANALHGAVSIGVSVEAKGGSVTGRPGGPFVFEGPVL
ncbi:anti-sigma factor, partial [Piscinibacter sp.]|uniref:anti-sigma factor n=1 Tax=Piscinibacter sp. TaxID=1903157 RepID=UPI002F3F94EE